MIIRRYEGADFGSCLALFEGNVPAFFSPSERAEYAGFLREGPAIPYLVLEQDGALLAAGGVSVGPSGWGALHWGMVARSRQREGLGRRLLEARLALAREMPGAIGLRLETSQKTCGFYEGFGFASVGVVKDGFGAGLDAVEMVLEFHRAARPG